MLLRRRFPARMSHGTQERPEHRVGVGDSLAVKVSQLFVFGRKTHQELLLARLKKLTPLSEALESL